MKEEYTVNEILSAIDDLQNFKKDKKSEIIPKIEPIKKNLEIPSNTLRLIEEAEKTIRSKLQTD